MNKTKILPPKVRNFLHHHDIFGYPIPISFNGRKTYHTTPIGGIFSIIIQIGYICFFISLLFQMIGYQDDIIYEHLHTNSETRNGVNFRDLNMQMYNALYQVNEEGYSESLFLNDQTR